MVLNHIYSRKTDKGGIEYFWPDEVKTVHDDGRSPVTGTLRADGSASNTTASARCPRARTTASTRRR
jgi:hypothetical protein